MKNRIIAITITLLVATVGALSLVQCDHSNMARVTIHIQNDLYAQKSESIIDKVLNIFNSKLHAQPVPPGWSPNHDDGTIYVTTTGPDMQTIQTSIPVPSSSFTVEVPAGNQRTIRVVFDNESGEPGDVRNTWGGQKTVDLNPGDNEVNLLMLPLTEITAVPSLDVPGDINLSWAATGDWIESVTGYNIYRSTSPDENFVKIHTIEGREEDNSSDTPGTGTYYYKISVQAGEKEGIKSETTENSVATLGSEPPIN